MIELTPSEARVLGVLIEKGFTTPNQYPLSVNAISNGASQLSNRDPVMQFTDDQAFDAAEGLRNKGLAVRVDQVGSRVHKYKHIAVETLRCRQAEVAILAELLLRGPQTLGELRGRASRMQAFESLERVTEMLRALMEREEPLVRQLPPLPGSRAERYAQLLCRDVNLNGSNSAGVNSEVQNALAANVTEQNAPQANASGANAVLSANPTVENPPVPFQHAAPQSTENLSDRVAKLEEELAALKAAMQFMATELGMSSEVITKLESQPKISGPVPGR